MYAGRYKGPGLATGGPKDGFAGRYHVRYFYDSGEFSDEYDLIIEKADDTYKVSWHRIYTSVCSAISRASSTSIPRYRTVLSSFEWPSNSCTALRFFVLR